jgi:two-component system phosphate regulon response regulator PhoB
LDLSGPAPENVCVLVSDRDPAVRYLLEQVLRRRRYTVRTSSEPLAIAREPDMGRVDLAVVQIGGELQLGPIRALRTTAALSEVWILALLGPTEEDDLPVALEEGADDCMVKPISPRELLARVEAMVRRIRRPVSALAFDGLTIDLRTREVRVGDELVPMPPREFDLLAFLALHPNEVLTRERLLAEVWGPTAAWQPSETLTEHMHRLRRRIEIEPAQPRWLQTARGVGYRFHADHSS